ncbi:MAG: ATP-binding cassette domain-containing protein [Lactobacillaceae bacterium]|jgi:putative ABC transport system ATP-binding protein|nr:ATP-binding cassette domain-containing protein [Lactobacillaceae bacterium]
MMNAIASVNDVSVKISGKLILNHVSCSFLDKTMTVIYGSSGSGKTTLLNVLGGLESPTSGEVELFKQAVPKPNSKKANLFRRNQVSYLFQNFALLDDQTIKRNLEVGLKYSGLTRKQRELKMCEALQRVNLPTQLLGAKIFSLSGGEKQRVALARVLLKPSRIIFADEPTGSLDPENRDTIIGILKAISKYKPVIIVSHDQAVIEAADVKINLASISNAPA